MYQHPDMKSLDIVSSCRDALYPCSALFADYKTVQNGKTSGSGRSPNITPIGYLSGYIAYSVDQVDYQAFGCLNIIIVYLLVRLVLEHYIRVSVLP